MSRAAARTCAVVVMVAALCVPVVAGDRAVTRDGTIHRIESIPWVDGTEGTGGIGGSALQHTVRYPDGTRDSWIVPGTDDFTPDLEPRFDLDPITEWPVVAWSRIEKRGATEIRVARFEHGKWTASRIVFAGGTTDTRPQIRVAGHVLHVLWRQDRDGLDTRHMRVDLDRDNLDPVYGPEKLPLTGFGPDSGPEQEPDDNLTYFAAGVETTVPGGTGSMVVWGIRDEPVPITYVRAFALPPQIQSARRAVAEWIEGRFVLWFESGAKFYHTRLTDGMWTPMQVIDLSDGLAAAEARMMVQSMLRREDVGSDED